ncbi:hypothetical protein E2C01_002976 [Portunus trituberculatus]|uniref:PLAT domain-containing protein n=1 Tax=Portunus trituberculatus TaxID=210409 RepID=A0A5B7CKX5_PORTR|nr:hypothetical protein [Portunus trituberculatus]
MDENLTGIEEVTTTTVGSLQDVSVYTTYLCQCLYVVAPSLSAVCNLEPEDPDAPLVVLESKFKFWCNHTDHEVPIKYGVFCDTSGDPEINNDIQLYSDFYPDATGILIPNEICDAYAVMEDAYQVKYQLRMGKIIQKSPTDIILPPIDNTTDPEDVLTSIEDVMDHIDTITGNETKPELTPVKKTVIITTAAARVDELLKNNSTSEFQERSSEVLSEITDHLIELKDEPSSPLLEANFHNATHLILQVADNLRVLQNQSEANGTGISPRVTSDIQTIVTTVTEATLARTKPGELLNVTAPNIEVQVWKVSSNDTIGKSINVKDVELEMPEGVGEGNISLSAVTTTMNPQPDTYLEYATSFINISLEGPGVDKQDFPLVYSFPRNTKVLDDPESPNRIVFNLTGKAYCVRYDSTKKLYGWRILSNSATMSIDIPAGGRAFMSINTHASLYIKADVHTVSLQINNKTIGKLCWPVLDEVIVSNIKLLKALSNKNEDELWIENGRGKKTQVGLKFQISYTELMPMSPPQECDAALSRKEKFSYPVNTTIKILQMLGQCLVYDEITMKFVNDERCSVFPEKDSIRCECSGSSVRTAVDAPVTNNIDFTDIAIDLKDNPVPFIFSVNVACLFLLLSFLGAIQDIRGKRKLFPLTDSEKTTQPVKYNVFIYLSKFRCPRGKKNKKFTLSLQGNTGVSVSNTYTSPGVSHGAMLHLVHHSDELLGPVRKVVITLQHNSLKWHVSRVVVSDAVEQDLAVFFFDCWVAGESKSRSRTSVVERNCWRENFFTKVISDILEGIPIIMLLLPGGVQDRKLDHMLTYAVSLLIWALLQLWFYEAVHPLYRPDDCIQGSASATQAAVNSLIRMVLNLVLITLSTILIEGIIKVALMYKEKKSKESRSFRMNGLLPLPHWVRLAVRGVAIIIMLITVSFLTLMSYLFTKAEFNAWLLTMGEAFAFQIASKSLTKVLTNTAHYLLYLPDPEKFNEDMLNPEGMKVMCPVCHVCPKELHRHFRSHLSLNEIQQPRRSGQVAHRVRRLLPAVRVHGGQQVDARSGEQVPDVLVPGAPTLTQVVGQLQ